MKCRDCIYYNKDAHIHYQGVGRCIVFPPTVTSNESFYPVVQEHMFCRYFHKAPAKVEVLPKEVDNLLEDITTKAGKAELIEDINSGCIVI